MSDDDLLTLATVLAGDIMSLPYEEFVHWQTLIDKEVNNLSFEYYARYFYESHGNGD